MAFELKDYVQVNERIEAFYAKFPEGSIQSEIVELTDSRVTVKAWAYRTPDDQRPGIGHSFMNIPGSTSYTKGSELENTETSAWGRALAALGFEVKRGIASAQEVQNKRAPAKAKASHPDDDLGLCPEHNEPWVRSMTTGKVGHLLEGTEPCLREEVTA